jgi:hypothetical protein
LPHRKPPINGTFSARSPAKDKAVLQTRAANAKFAAGLR